MRFQCSSLVNTKKKSHRSLREAMPLSQLAKELMEELNQEDAPSGKYVLKQVDLMPDLSEDEAESPISGGEIMLTGKHKGKMTLRQVYMEDKDYVQWARDQPGTNWTKEMKRFRLYIECRDQTKMSRLGMNTEERKKTQMPKLPQNMAKTKAAPKKQARPREGDG